MDTDSRSVYVSRCDIALCTVQIPILEQNILLKASH